MSLSTYPKVKRDGTLTLNDNAVANSYTLTYENGDIKFNKPKASQVVVMDRGSFGAVRKGDDQVISGSFSVSFRQWTSTGGSAVANLCDVLDGVGGAAGWTKWDANYEQFNLQAVFSIAGGTDNANSVATFNTCIFEWDFSEGDPDTLNCTFNCYGGVSFTGPT